MAVQEGGGKFIGLRIKKRQVGQECHLNLNNELSIVFASVSFHTENSNEILDFKFRFK